MRVLGLAFTGHGASICLVEDGRIAGAINLERLTRHKASLAGLPRHERLLKTLRTGRREESEPSPRFFNFYDVFPEMLHYVTGERTLERAGIDLVVKTRDNIRPIGGQTDAAYQSFLKSFGNTRVELALEHHLAHAYQAYLCSPFDEAAILTVDGTGEALERNKGVPITATLCAGRGGRIKVLSEVFFPFTLGGLYASFTRHLGFGHDQEGNTMALASFGNDAALADLKRNAVRLFPDGTFSLLIDDTGLALLAQLEAAVEPRHREAPIEQAHKDWAWLVQAITEEVLIHAARCLVKRTGCTHLAMAGGVALNCVANAKVLEDTPVDRLYVMPNAGDRGLSAGCALYGYHVLLGGTERHPPEHDYLGRSYDDSETHLALRTSGLKVRRSADIAQEVAQLVASGKIVGWHQGGAEFGPRALGHRSILADPRTLRSKERLDSDIKKREWFRPYCPSVLKERAAEFFEVTGDAPYMLLAVAARPEHKDKIAGVVHVDGTARIQTVDARIEPRYHRLISAFDRLTGIPMVLNTSFNASGEPMVESPRDALAAFRAMGLDALAIGDHLVEEPSEAS